MAKKYFTDAKLPFPAGRPDHSLCMAEEGQKQVPPKR